MTVMRLLVVTHYYTDHRGGVERVAAELAERLAQRGWKVEWVAHGPAGGLPEGVKPLAMRGCNLAERWLGLPYPIWGPLSLWRLVCAVCRADAVHLHDSIYLGSVVASLAAWFSRKPVLMTQHVGPIPYRSTTLRLLLGMANRVLGRFVLGNCAQAVFVSERVRDYFGRFVQFRREPLVIANGVDCEIFNPATAADRDVIRARLGWSERPVLLFVGRFVEKKGLPLLHELARQCGDLTWAFAGWGPLDPAGWQLPNVVCLGERAPREIADLYRAADLLVLPSVGEGFPLVIQEALACGLAVLTSPDTAAGLGDAATSCHVAELNTGAWREQLALLMTDRDALESGREMRAQFAREHWSWDHCANHYDELLRQMVK